MQYYGNTYFSPTFFDQVYFGPDQSSNLGSVGTVLYFQADYLPPWHFQSDYWNLFNYPSPPPIPLPKSAQYFAGNFDIPTHFQSDYWDLNSYAVGSTLYISSYSPGNNTTVPITTQPFVVFSITPQTGLLSFTLNDSSGNVVPSTSNYQLSSNTYNLVPNFPLNVNQNYSATVSGIENSLNAIINPFSWNFSTSSAGGAAKLYYIQVPYPPRGQPINLEIIFV